jgi:cAMP-dependent protein kinase regulator
VDDYEISQICDALQTIKVTTGEYLIKEGETGDKFYIIEDGEAFAEKFNKDLGKKVSVLDYEKGSYFGELALIRDEPRAASVVAKTNCKLLSLDRMSFKRLLGPIETLLKRNSDAYIKFMKK